MSSFRSYAIASAFIRAHAVRAAQAAHTQELQTLHRHPAADHIPDSFSRSGSDVAGTASQRFRDPLRGCVLPSHFFQVGARRR